MNAAKGQAGGRTSHLRSLTTVKKILGRRGTEGIQRARENWSAIEDAAAASDIDPRLLAAIGIRETNFRNITGDHGHGHGVFQIDDRYHSTEAATIAYDISQSALFAAGLLANGVATYSARGYSYEVAELAAVREYNGTGHVPTEALLRTSYLGYLSIGTTGNDYVKDVLLIAFYCF